MHICSNCHKEIEGNKKCLSNHYRFCAKTITHLKPHTIETKERISKKLKGIKRSGETRAKMGIAKKGEKNPNWGGSTIGYTGLHQWIKRNKQKPILCEICHCRKPYDLANISQQYKRDINDFEWLCRKCHMEKDGRMKVFLSNRIYA